MLKLEVPTKENLAKVKAGVEELKANPTPYDIGQVKTLIQYVEQGDFDGYVARWNEKRAPQQPEGKVPATLLFLFDDEKFIGFYDVRHYLNDFLRTQGGHIAYQIIPSERGKGYVRCGLKLVLQWCYDNLQVKEVMLSCNAENYASDKAMTAVMNEVGGRRDPDIKLDDHIERRLWLNTIKTRD